MAERAQELLAGSGWLPEPLRTAGRPIGATPPTSVPDAISRTGFGGEDAPSTAYENAEPDPRCPADHVIGAAEQPLVVAE